MASKKGKILVVDDNAGIRQALKILLPLQFAEVEAIPSPVTLASTLERFRPEVVLLDMNFNTSVNSGNEGLYWTREIKRMMPEVEVVLFTAYADIALAVEGMKRGAFDFVVKPWDNAKLMATLAAARDKAQRAKEADSSASGLKMTGGGSSSGRFESQRPCHSEQGLREGWESMFWGSTPAMASIRRLVEKVAPTDATVLITGENGTGKDVLAREVHAMSPRSGKPMVSVDAGAITETLFESELFGHVKGAFTDARADHAGMFEQADGGTLFLDEIGNIPLHLQAKLLRAIQSRSVTRVGGSRAVSVDIRLICATNMDLARLVSSEQFREDLYYRINTVHISMPPLRERREDIVPLSEMFVRRFAEKYHRPVTGISEEAARLLREAWWSGNIRELQNCIEKAVILSEGDMITLRDIQADASPALSNAIRNRAPNASNAILTSNVILSGAKNLSSNEEALVRDAMARSGGNISAAAKMLGISRPTMYSKLKKYGI